MAGVAGFEPTNDGVRVRCLTAWRHPNTMKLLIIYMSNLEISHILYILNGKNSSNFNMYFYIKRKKPVLNEKLVRVLIQFWLITVRVVGCAVDVAVIVSRGSVRVGFAVNVAVILVRSAFISAVAVDVAVIVFCAFSRSATVAVVY